MALKLPKLVWGAVYAHGNEVILRYEASENIAREYYHNQLKYTVQPIVSRYSEEPFYGIYIDDFDDEQGFYSDSVEGAMKAVEKAREKWWNDAYEELKELVDKVRIASIPYDDVCDFETHIEDVLCAINPEYDRQAL